MVAVVSNWLVWKRPVDPAEVRVPKIVLVACLLVTRLAASVKDPMIALSASALSARPIDAADKQQLLAKYYLAPNLLERVAD